MHKMVRTNKQKIIRTLRCKNKNIVGTLAGLLNCMAKAKTDIGNIETVYVGEFYHIRDITVIADNEEHFEEIVAQARKAQNVEIKQIIDEVLELHHGGKIRTVPKYPVDSVEDLQKVYTPGVAQVCTLIKRDPKQAATFTSIQKNVALITNGSRVLGLGNLGPVASMPVMEGKAALFSQLTGFNMFPILLETRDPDEFVETVKRISHGFGAIQLEDIETPASFEIEERLKKELDKPVMHDDQHGTAVVALAAAINACRLAGQDIKKLKIGQLGLGAAGLAIAKLIGKYTNNSVLGSDINEDALNRLERNGGKRSSLEDIMKDCDLVVMTTGRRGLIKPEHIQKGQIILSLSNPYPEINIEDALQAGATFALDGTRVNNLLGYPGIFKAALEVNATAINDEMLIAAAEAIAQSAPEDDPVPDALDIRVHDAVTKAVAQAAINTGVARNIPDEVDVDA